MPHPLGSILNPQSVAVVGASREPGKIGYNVVKRLMDGGFAGDVYPINPNTTEMFGLPCYPSVVAVPGPIDLAVLTVTDRLVASVVEDCIGKGVKGAIIITAGFAETGPEGKTKEQTLVDRARASGIRIMGPNCMGLYNAALKLNVTGVSPIPSGSLAFVSQSGGMGQELFHAASRIGAGFSYFISLGNEADIRFHEYLEYLEGDDSTRAILLYMEGLRDGRHFLEVAARVTRVKPIVAIKGGATPAGSRSSLSHTGALAGADAIFDAAFRQVGVIRVEEPEELIEVAHSLAILPIPKGPRVGILCDGGGYATILSDAAERHHLSVPVLSPPVQERLVPLMPHRASPRNPVEFAGAADDDPMAFARCAEVCLRSTEVDGLLLAGTFGGYASIFSERLAPIEMQTSRSLGGLLREHRKPIIMQTFFARDPIPALQILRDEGVPVVASLERAARCLDALVRRASIFPRPAWTATPPPVSSTGSRDKPELRHDGLFLESEAYEILGRYGVRHPAYQVIHNETEVEPAMSALGVPVVMKVLSTNVPHKTDVGGIAMDVSAPDHARRTFAALMTVARNTGEPEPAVLVVQQVSRGIEMIIGVAQDASVGPVVMIGLGGIFVEIVKDVAFRVMPITRGDAEEMLRELRAFRVLHGYRGYPPTDVNAIVELLLQVSNLVRDFPHVQQLDLNPVIVQPHGVTVVDVKLKL